MARCSQETPQSGMNLFLGTVLLLLLLPGEWQVKGGQAQEVYGLCGKVSPWEGVHQNPPWGFHPEIWTGQRGASPLGCAEVSRVGDFVAGGFFKTWVQQSRVSFVSPSGRVDTVVLPSPAPIAVQVFLKPT